MLQINIKVQVAWHFTKYKIQCRYRMEISVTIIKKKKKMIAKHDG